MGDAAALLAKLLRALPRVRAGELRMLGRSLVGGRGEKAGALAARLEPPPPMPPKLLTLRGEAEALGGRSWPPTAGRPV